MNWKLPNPAELYEAVAGCALVSCVIVLWLGPVFGPLLIVVLLAMTAHLETLK